MKAIGFVVLFTREEGPAYFAKTKKEALSTREKLLDALIRSLGPRWTWKTLKPIQIRNLRQGILIRRLKGEINAK